jgi:hypothetical protein
MQKVPSTVMNPNSQWQQTNGRRGRWGVRKDISEWLNREFPSSASDAKIFQTRGRPHLANGETFTHVTIVTLMTTEGGALTQCMMIIPSMGTLARQIRAITYSLYSDDLGCIFHAIRSHRIRGTNGLREEDQHALWGNIGERALFAEMCMEAQSILANVSGERGVKLPMDHPLLNEIVDEVAR